MPRWWPTITTTATVPYPCPPCHRRGRHELLFSPSLPSSYSSSTSTCSVPFADKDVYEKWCGDCGGGGGGGSGGGSGRGGSGGGPGAGGTDEGPFFGDATAAANGEPPHLKQEQQQVLQHQAHHDQAQQHQAPPLEWTSCGSDGWLVGCALPESLAEPELNGCHPDRRRGMLASPEGIYSAGCGIAAAGQPAWGSEEYMFHMLRHNGASLPGGLAALRLCPLRCWHAHGAYAALESAATGRCSPGRRPCTRARGGACGGGDHAARVHPRRGRALAALRGDPPQVPAHDGPPLVSD